MCSMVMEERRRGEEERASCLLQGTHGGAGRQVVHVAGSLADMWRERYVVGRAERRTVRAGKSIESLLSAIATVGNCIFSFPVIRPVLSSPPPLLTMNDPARETRRAKKKNTIPQRPLGAAQNVTR